MDPVRMKALDKAIDAGGNDPDGSMTVRRARTYETYLRGDAEDEKEDEPEQCGERVRLPNDFVAKTGALFKDAEEKMAQETRRIFGMPAGAPVELSRADYIARLNTGAAKPPEGQETI